MASLSHRNLPTAICVAAISAANLGALALAWYDQSWMALAIAMYIGPIGNAVLALLSSLAAVPFLNIPAFSVRRHLVVSIAAPVGAVIVDYIAIAAMPLHGC